MKHDNSINSIRAFDIISDLEFCDNYQDRERILVERIIELENSLHELELSYFELLRRFDKDICVHLPF